MTTKEYYAEAYRRVRVIRGIGKTPIAATAVREPLQPVPIPQHIKSAAIASYKNRKVQECIDSLGLAEYFD